ncbi:MULTISPECIES: hypothetical protein [unclassified Variovorax]|uniref:hypothetical protein n=1 Tax=unclassified Variovorax TaxID=663243 RepID=UPI001BD676F0|nr:MULTISPECIES: hypothetical protein [unclassified Variovorax]
MNSSDIVALANKLDAAGLLLPAPTPLDGSDLGTDRIHQSLVVNLAQVIAESGNARSVDIYTDTLVVSDGMRVQIGNTPQRLSIIARRIVVEGSGTGHILLAHDGAGPIGAVRILTGSVVGDFRVVSVRNKKHEPYDLERLKENSERPCYTVFHWRDDASAISRSEVPAGLLRLGRPLYRSLATSFDLCAGALGAPSNERVAMVQAMLGWVARFAGLHADLAPIGRISEAVRALLPVAQGDDLVHPIPPRTADSYRQLAWSRKELARATGLDIKFLDLTGTIGDIAHQFVSAGIGRDRQEAKLIEGQVIELALRRKTIAAAMERVARDIADQKFEANLQSIRLGLALELDKIDKIVKASFEVVGALINLATSLGAIAMGVPPLPGGGSHGDIKGVTGLIDAVKNTKYGGMFAGGGLDHLMTVINLFALPVTFAWENGADHANSIKKLLDATSAIQKAGTAILNNLTSPDLAAEMSSLVGEAIRAIAGKPHPIEAKAAWDAIEVDVVNGLQLIIDGEFSDAVKQAAIKYKTLMEKVCIQGRVLSEYQAAGDAVDRAQGTLVLQRLAQIGKQAELEKLQATLTERTVLAETIKAEITLRQQAAAREFFEACYGFQRATFFETYTPTTFVVPEVLSDPALMEARCAAMETDHADATRLIGIKQVDFDREIFIDDPELMARLERGTVTFPLSPNHPLLATLSHVRLTSVQARLETTPALTGHVALILYSGESCQDRIDSTRNARFFGWFQPFPFEYRGDKVELSRELKHVLLPPFSDWTIGISQPLSPPKIVGLRVRLIGQAFL